MQQEKDTEHGMNWDNRFTTEEDTTEPEESSYQYTADTFSSNLQAFVAFDLLMESQGYWAGSPENEINWGVTEENLTEPEEGLYHPPSPLTFQQSEGYWQQLPENAASWREAHVTQENPIEPETASYQQMHFPPARSPLPHSLHWQQPFMSETNTATPTNNSNWSAFFPCSKHFIVSGGHFTGSVTNYLPNPVPSDFRMILLGDIYLQKEIQVAGNSGVVCGHYSVNEMACTHARGPNINLLLQAREQAWLAICIILVLVPVPCGQGGGGGNAGLCAALEQSDALAGLSIMILSINA
ncbi:hypothetical protein B0H10DRAFT_1968984 [Mycena sp. CBHHK59/15]|nr:hypothetical protein B0H10DRAFT_1968984 [Mycena sp. CBHHK59/15]